MSRKTWRRSLLFLTLGLLAVVVLGGSLVSSYQRINRPFPGFFLYRNMVVGPDFLPHWSGARAGISFLDRIVAVDDEVLSTPAEVYDAVSKRPPGTQFRYTVEKSGQRSHVMVPSMSFSFSDWLLSFGIYLAAGVGFLAIGVAPVYLRSSSPSAPALLFMVTMIFLWFATTYDFMTTQVLPKEIRALAFALTPSAGIHVGLLLTGGKARGRKHRLYVALVYGLSLILGLSYSLTFHGPVELWHWALRSSYGYSLMASLGFLLLLGRELKRPGPQLQRSRLRVVFVGAALGFFFPTLGAVLRAFLGWEIPHNFLLILAAFFPLSVAYALLKYNLFDIGAVLKVGLTRGALTGLLLLVYVSVVSLLSLGTGIYEKDVLAPLFFAVLVVLIFNPLLRWLEGVVDRYICGQAYDSNQLQRDVSLLLRSLAEPQLTAERFLKTVADRIGVETACLFFQPSGQETCVAVSLNGELDPGTGRRLVSGSSWNRYFGARWGGVSKAEVETDPGYGASRAEILGLFRQLSAELVIPIVFERVILGLVAFGGKRSGREYSASDFQLLCSLADQLALSLENGTLYEESEKAKKSYRSLYDEAQVMNERLIDADRLKKQFVANISHELRTPISTILGYSELLSDPGFRGDTRTALERLVSSGQNLSQLMDNLLDFSRMEAETLALTLQEVNLREALESLEIMTRRLIKERPVRFCLQVDRSPETIRTDPKKLQQILMHLLTNALKFTERGEISIQVQAVAEGPDTVLEILVSDTGIGIGKEDQEIIFDDFRQLDGSTTRKYGGTGLGLSLCRKLAQSLGGKITVDSEPGKGSVFSLFLPLTETEAVALPALQAV
jgi:signal transduction histidine kinase